MIEYWVSCCLFISDLTLCNKTQFWASLKKAKKTWFMCVYMFSLVISHVQFNSTTLLNVFYGFVFLTLLSQTNKVFHTGSLWSGFYTNLIMEVVDSFIASSGYILVVL